MAAHSLGTRRDASAPGFAAGLVPAAVLVLAAALSSCASVPRIAGELAPPPSGGAAWTALVPGIDYASFSLASPPREARALRVDLRAPGLDCVVTAGDGRPSGTVGRTTLAFAREAGCVVAVNASPFSPVSSRDGEPRTIVGLSVAEGRMVSPPLEGYAALILRSDRSATIVEQEPAMDLSLAVCAVGGFGRVLSGGRILGHRDVRHPRTAAGLSGDGRTLYLLVIDGRQARSVGASTEELGAWLAWLGASEGLNLDGGGSTTMVLRASDGRLRVANTPIHGGWPGAMRVVGNSLGFRLAGGQAPERQGSAP